MPDIEFARPLGVPGNDVARFPETNEELADRVDGMTDGQYAEHMAAVPSTRLELSVDREPADEHLRNAYQLVHLAAYLEDPDEQRRTIEAASQRIVKALRAIGERRLSTGRSPIAEMAVAG